MIPNRHAIELESNHVDRITTVSAILTRPIRSDDNDDDEANTHTRKGENRIWVMKTVRRKLVTLLRTEWLVAVINGRVGSSPLLMNTIARTLRFHHNGILIIAAG